MSAPVSTQSKNDLPKRRLVDCGRLLSGGTPSKARPEFWEGDIPWFSSKELRSFELTETELGVSEEGALEGTTLVPPGTVLFVIRGMSLANEFRVGVTKQRSTFNQDVKALVPGPDVDSRYLARCLQSLGPKVVDSAETSSHGTKRLPSHLFENLEIPVPSLAAQRRIADILDRADAIRRKRKQALALTDALLRSTFLAMFGDPITNPKGWPEKSLESVAEVASGVTKGKQYGDEPKVERPYMRVANVQDGYIRLDEVKTIEVSRADAERYRLECGDVLLTEGGDPDKLGRGAVWEEQVADCLHQNHIFRVRPFGNLAPEYLSTLIGSARGKRYFLQASKQTTGIASINMRQLKAFPVLVPPRALQLEFLRATRSIRALQGKLREAVADSEMLFASIAFEAFGSGARE